ncbi:DoxX family protein [Croceitalea sp. P059]|uniref:DoxX family protein n=1 Tax=Croceitalea sp. P059 TaxID=3075601 RepID=UPI002887EE5D|nr:DoxX family protein [Croceitalea sp. P059]MDT0540706.1 DoxX family protein [Croceitalea sp. P059]
MSKKTANRIYYTAKSLLSILMLLSAGMYIIFPQAETFVKLGYPTYIIYPLAIAKILGVSAIWLKQLKSFKQWAYAGFFYDMVLAFAAHIYVKDGEWPPALAGLVFVIVAVIYEKKVEN